MSRTPVPDDIPRRFPPAWLAEAVETAKQPGPYPKWLTAALKAFVMIGVLTAFAEMAAHRSAKTQLARLVTEAAQVKPEPTQTGSIRRR